MVDWNICQDSTDILIFSVGNADIAQPAETCTTIHFTSFGSRGDRRCDILQFLFFEQPSGLKWLAIAPQLCSALVNKFEANLLPISKWLRLYPLETYCVHSQLKCKSTPTLQCLISAPKIHPYTQPQSSMPNRYVIEASATQPPAKKEKQS